MGEAGRWGGGGGAGVVLGAALLLALLQAATANTDTKARLTTSFGKPKPQQPPQQAKPRLGPTCSRQSDCDPFVNTSCIKDPRDSHNRCLCGDRNPPTNGQCKNTFRIVRFPCSADNECIENAECVFPANISSNATQGVPELMTYNSLPSHAKICWCKEGLKPNEDLDECGDDGMALIPSAALVFASIFIHFMKL